MLGTFRWYPGTLAEYLAPASRNRPMVFISQTNGVPSIESYTAILSGDQSELRRAHHGLEAR